MGRRKTRFDESAILNKASYRMYYDHLIELALSRFQWINLPPTINPVYMEKTLLTRGAALFFMDEVIGPLALGFNGQGQYNIYNEPMRRRAFASNGYQTERDGFDSVIIFNNYGHTPSIQLLKYYAMRLYDLDRTMDINARAQKTPALIVCDETQRTTLLNLYQQYDGNAPVIFGDTGLNKEALTFISTTAPYVADQINELKNNVWNEILTFLGISNVSLSKRERLVRDEVNRNMGGTIASRYGPLESRQLACDQINAMFGLDIQCYFHDDQNSEETSAEAEEEPENERDI